MPETTATPAAAPAAPPPAAAVDPKAAAPAAPQTPPPTTEPKPATQKDAARFAALARKERELVAQKQAIAKEREALQGKMAALEGFEKAKGSAKADPLALLEQHGLTYEDLTNYVLNGKKPTADLQARAVDEKLEAFKREQAAEREKLAAAEAKRIEAERKRVIDEFHEYVTTYVKDNAETYELINLHGAHEIVPQLIEQHFAKTQKIMSEKEAADQVEKFLEEQIEKSLATKKLATRFAKPAEPKPSTEAAQPRATLTNSMAPAITTQPPAALTEQERIKRAVAAFDRSAAK